MKKALIIALISLLIGFNISIAEDFAEKYISILVSIEHNLGKSFNEINSAISILSNEADKNKKKKELWYKQTLQVERVTRCFSTLLKIYDDVVALKYMISIEYSRDKRTALGIRNIIRYTDKSSRDLNPIIPTLKDLKNLINDPKAKKAIKEAIKEVEKLPPIYQKIKKELDKELMNVS